MSALAAVLLVRLFDELAAFLPAGTLESFRSGLGLSYAQAATVLAAIGPGAVVGGVFAAAADTHSRRVIAAGGAFGFAAALAVFALGGSFPVLVAAAFGMGMASTAMVDGAEVALVDLVRDDLRRYLARGNVLGTIGALAGPALITAAAVAGVSWRAVFAVAAVLMALYGAALAATPLPGPVDHDLRDPSNPGRAEPPASGVLRDPGVWAVGVLGLLLTPFDETFVGFVIALLERVRGASPAVGTGVAVLGISGGLLSFTALSRRLERVDDADLLVASVWAMTVGAAAIGALPYLPVVAVAAFLVSVGLNLGWLVVQHRSLTVRPGQVGRTKAVLNVIELGGFWIPVAIGAVADRAGLRLAMTAFVALGLAMVAVARVDRARARRPAPTS